MMILVEGHAEQRVLPILFQRYGNMEAPRIVNMEGKANIVRLTHGFEATVRRQRAVHGERSFVVLIDGDVAFPPYASIVNEQDQMPRRAQALANELTVTIKVCWAILELESWLIGGIQPRAAYCGLRNVGRIPANTQTHPVDPKQWLANRLADDYGRTSQNCLARNIDLDQAIRRNRSMRDFFGDLTAADNL